MNGIGESTHFLRKSDGKQFGNQDQKENFLNNLTRLIR